MAPAGQLELESELRSLLAGGDPRSIGRSGEAVEWIRRSPDHARAAVSAIDDPDVVAEPVILGDGDHDVCVPDSPRPRAWCHPGTRPLATVG